MISGSKCMQYISDFGHITVASGFKNEQIVSSILKHSICFQLIYMYWYNTILARGLFIVHSYI